MGRQGRGRRLTDRERLEIIEYAQQHPQVKHVELAAKYHVNESTIRKWRREPNACKVQARCQSSGLHDRRRGQAARAQQFDSQLYSWICSAKDRGEKLRPATIRAKAKTLAATYEQMASFKASSGWYYRYCRRFGLTLDDSRGGVQTTGDNTEEKVRDAETGSNKVALSIESDEHSTSEELVDAEDLLMGIPTRTPPEQQPEENAGVARAPLRTSYITMQHFWDELVARGLFSTSPIYPRHSKPSRT